MSCTKRWSTFGTTCPLTSGLPDSLNAAIHSGTCVGSACLSYWPVRIRMAGVFTLRAVTDGSYDIMPAMYRSTLAIESRRCGTAATAESRCAAVSLVLCRAMFSSCDCAAPRSGRAFPASSTSARSDGSSSATIGALIAPSLWPTSPSRVVSISLRVRRYANPARVSWENSWCVVPLNVPPDCPTPRSSMRNTAMPRRPSESAICRNGRKPTRPRYSSRS